MRTQTCLTSIGGSIYKGTLTCQQMGIVGSRKLYTLMVEDINISVIGGNPGSSSCPIKARPAVMMLHSYSDTTHRH